VRPGAASRPWSGRMSTWSCGSCAGGCWQDAAWWSARDPLAAVLRRPGRRTSRGILTSTTFGPALPGGLGLLRDASSYSSPHAVGTAHRRGSDPVAAGGEGGGAGAGGRRPLWLRCCRGSSRLVGLQHCGRKTPPVTDRESLLTSPLADHGRGCISSHAGSVPEPQRSPNESWRRGTASRSGPARGGPHRQARRAVAGPYQGAFRKPRPLAMPGQARYAGLPRTRRGWCWNRAGVTRRRDRA
jgi:hypothetical protein